MVKPRMGRVHHCYVKDLVHQLGLENKLELLKTYEASSYALLMDLPIHKGDLGETAGWCFIKISKGVTTRWIELHEELFVPGREEELTDTFMHELGHALDGLRRNRSSHGREWRIAMTHLGCSYGTDRCHSYPFLMTARLERAKAFLQAKGLMA